MMYLLLDTSRTVEDTSKNEVRGTPVLRVELGARNRSVKANNLPFLSCFQVPDDDGPVSRC